MVFRVRNPARQLTGDQVVLSVKRRSGFAYGLGAVVLVLALVGGALWLYDDMVGSAPLAVAPVSDAPPQAAVADGESGAAAGKSVQAWQAELERVRLEHEIEVATRQELERQIVTLKEQLKETESALEFVKSTNSQTPRKP